MVMQIMNIRTIHRQLTNLLSQAEQGELRTAEAFSIFSGMNPVLYNPYTEPLWQNALQHYENFLKPAEQRIAHKLKAQLRGMKDNVLQVSTVLHRRYGSYFHLLILYLICIYCASFTRRQNVWKPTEYVWTNGVPLDLGCK